MPDQKMLASLARELRRVLARIDQPSTEALKAEIADTAAKRQLRDRRVRDRHFDPSMFFDPAWNILLDLYVAEQEGTRISVQSASIASGAPPTTGLRYVGHLVKAGMLEREACHIDRRRVWVSLSHIAKEKLDAYFEAVS